MLKRSPVRVGATISEINSPNQTTKDMVFSQTSLKAQTVLKVVKLDHSKTEKKHLLNGSTAAASSIDGYCTAPSSPVAHTSCSEVSLKVEPPFDNAMFHDLDSEFFQELDPLYYVPEKEEAAQTIDSFKKTEEKALDIDKPLIPRYVWEQPDVNSPQPQAGYYNALSPNEFGQYDNLFTYAETDKNMNQINEKSYDINSLPMVLDLASDQAISWPAEQVAWTYPPDTQFNIIYDHNATFINTEDSVDLKIGSVIPTEVDYTILNNVASNMNKEEDVGAMQLSSLPKRRDNLSLDVTVRAPAWSGDVSTPAILNEVMALEENSTEISDQSKLWQLQNTSTETFEFKNSPKVDYEPITPKSESVAESDNDDSKSHVSRRRRHDSEDSDETYSPYSETIPRKRRKPKVPIKDLLAALESQPKVRRGRPPKRRESTVSSVCSVDENSSSVSTTEYKYRELRDKNNEASKRSRMNRKVKEQQMEELAVKLEEANKRLKVRADVLEEMTKKLKNALMTAMLNQ